MFEPALWLSPVLNHGLFIYLSVCLLEREEGTRKREEMKVYMIKSDCVYVVY